MRDRSYVRGFPDEVSGQLALEPKGPAVSPRVEERREEKVLLRRLRGRRRGRDSREQRAEVRKSASRCRGGNDPAKRVGRGAGNVGQQVIERAVVAGLEATAPDHLFSTQHA